MKLRLLLSVGLMALLWWLGGCERPEPPVRQGPLAFSADTVAFDSIFVNFLTPSERLIVTNPEGQDLIVDRIWLEAGQDSEFEIMVDGIRADTVEEVLIRGRDSTFIFVNLRSMLRDDFAEEFLAFQVGDEVYRILLRAKVIDAYYFRARIEQEGEFVSLSEDSYFFREDTTLTPEKPIIYDGPIFIPDGVTVRIEPGTQIYFTPYKFGIRDSQGVRDVIALYSMWLIDGTVRAEGSPMAPVVFQGTRFDSSYQENPAQWRGLNFRKSSRNNLLEHAVVKNALIGVQVDSLPLTNQPKLTVRHSSIRNMGAHGVVGVGAAPGVRDNQPPTILMENTEVHTCQERTLLIWAGGKHEFYNCTFGNYNLANFSRRTPQALFLNWISPDGVNAFVYPAYVDLVNCIIYGSEDNEVVMDTLAGQPFERLSFDHCLLKVEPEEYLPVIRSKFTDCLLNQDPRFAATGLRDYRLQANSPAIDAGRDLSDRFTLDIRGLPDSSRTLPFDMGAWEFVE